LSLETLERLFEKNFLNKKCFLIVGQHFGNIFLLRQQIPTKNNKYGKNGALCSHDRSMYKTIGFSLFFAIFEEISRF